MLMVVGLVKRSRNWKAKPSDRVVAATRTTQLEGKAFRSVRIEDPSPIPPVGEFPGQA